MNSKEAIYNFHFNRNFQFLVLVLLIILPASVVAESAKSRTNSEIGSHHGSQETLSPGNLQDKEVPIDSIKVESGGWSSGGGIGLIYPNLTVTFLDITKKEDYPKHVVSPLVAQNLYDGPIIIEKPFSKFDDFHSIFKKRMSIWRKLDPEFFDKITGFTQSVEAYYFNGIVNIENFKNVFESKALYSPSIEEEFQYPLALFDLEVVYVIRNVFERLSQRDQEALIVHECLRQLRWANTSQSKFLTTSNIENATRIIMNSPSQESLQVLKSLIFPNSTFQNILPNQIHIKSLIIELNSIPQFLQPDLFDLQDGVQFISGKKVLSDQLHSQSVISPEKFTYADLRLIDSILVDIQFEKSNIPISRENLIKFIDQIVWNLSQTLENIKVYRGHQAINSIFGSINHWIHFLSYSYGSFEFPNSSCFDANTLYNISCGSKYND